MFRVVLQAIYFALPIYFGNTAPVLVKKLPVLNIPVDGGRMLGGQRLFGAHKTWRGMVFAPIAGVLTIVLQRYLGIEFLFFQELALIDYSTNSALLLGGLMGFGAILGDLIKSFFKRRIGIASGRPWVPFDQLDLIIGGLALSAFLYWPGITTVLILLIITPFLHWLTNLFAYFLKIKEVPW